MALAYFWSVRSPSRPSKAKLGVELASALLIALGIAGELGVGIEIASINTTLRGKSAELRSKNAELRSDSVQLLALVNKEAEDEQARRVEIQARVAWRRLTESQITDIGQALNHFPRITVAVGYEGIDGESALFASDIADALQASHTLNVVPEEGLLHMETPTLRKGHVIPTIETGVLIVPTKDKTSRSLASAILKELGDRGFDARIGKQPEKQVRIDVGPRPVGPQGEYKLQAEQEIKAKSQTTEKP
jgi:hypothetical protein